MSNSKRVLAFDALRVFAIVSVVAIHTLMPYRQTLAPESAVRVFDDLLHYAVPLFAFISGALLWRKPLAPGRGSYVEFLTKRARVIALPYLAWATLFLGIRFATSARPLEALTEAPGLLLTGHVWYHLYFIPMLLTFYALTPVATHIAKRSPELLVLVAYAARLLAGAAVAEAFRSAFGDLGWSYATHIMTHLPHMALGAWFGIRSAGLPRSLRNSWPVLIAVGLSMTGAVSAGAIELGALPSLVRRLAYALPMAATVLGFTLAAFALETVFERHRASVCRLASLSFGVYFVHPLFLLAVDALLGATGTTRLWESAYFPVLVFVTVTALSFATSASLAVRARTSWLVGVGAPAQPPRQGGYVQPR